VRNSPGAPRKLGLQTTPAIEENQGRSEVLPRASFLVRAHGPRVTAVQIRTRRSKAEFDLGTTGPLARACRGDRRALATLRRRSGFRRCGKQRLWSSGTMGWVSRKRNNSRAGEG
jgi:hypothetical protein